MVLNAPSLQVLQDQVDALFPSGGLRTAASAHLTNITNDLDKGKTDNARKKAFELINFMRQKQKGGQLLDPNGTAAPTTGEAADALASSLFLYVGLTPAGTPPSAIAVDGAIAVVGPEGGTVLTGGDAPNGAVVFPAGALTQYVTVTIERLPDPNADNYTQLPYRKYAIAFDIKTVPTVTLPNTAKATVAVCTVEPPNAGAAPDPGRLILAHITGVESFELLPPGTSEGPLPSLCDDARLAALDAPPSGTLRFALWQAGRIGERALGALAPRSAYAGHGGLLGQTTTFSPFVPVDTFAVASVGVAPAAASIPVGGTAALTATPRNLNGQDMTGSVGAPSWSSSNAAVATVSSAGVVTGVSAGTATITATVEGVSGSSAVTVAPATVGFSPTIVGPGGPVTFTPVNASGAPTGVACAGWTSSNPTAGNFDGAPYYPYNQSGEMQTTTISATCTSGVVTQVVQVRPIPAGPAIVDVALSSTSLPIDGGNTPYTATLYNPGSAISTVFIQGYIVQGTTERGANGANLTCSTNGVMPSGSCVMPWSVGVSNSAAGSGPAFQPGPATFVLKLIQAGIESQTELDSKSFPVTLTSP
jgi:hypothetical protein